jgi:hypothetical protein
MNFAAIFLTQGLKALAYQKGGPDTGCPIVALSPMLEEPTGSHWRFLHQFRHFVIPFDVDMMLNIALLTLAISFKVMTHPLLRCRLVGDRCRCISDVTFSYASCAPVTSLPSAVTTSVYEQVSSLSPSETAILCRQRRCCNDCFLLIWLLLSRRLLLLHIVVISHNSIRIYNWSIRGQEVRFSSSLYFYIGMRN